MTPPRHRNPWLRCLTAPLAMLWLATATAQEPPTPDEDDLDRFPKPAPRPDASPPQRLGPPPPRADAQLAAEPPRKRFVAWKRALPDFCARRDTKTLELTPEQGGPWIYAWSFQGMVPDPTCYHDPAGLAISPRGQAPISARCPAQIEARDFDGDGHKDLFITHRDCDHPDLTAPWIELCLDRPGELWCAVIARDVLATRWLRRDGRLILRVTRADEPELAIAYGDDFPHRSWLDLSWEDQQVTARRYDNQPPPAGQEEP
jgi:hypothetical protein